VGRDFLTAMGGEALSEVEYITGKVDLLGKAI
jgi:hypothetical protein